MRKLKKYANRKIYDSENRCYVTIKDIKDMIQENQSVQVIDEKSGNDITRSVLIQIISDIEASEEETVLTDYVLQYLIRMYADPMSKPFAMYLDYSLKNFLQQQESINQQFETLLFKNQKKDLEKFTQQMMNSWSDFMGLNKN